MRMKQDCAECRRLERLLEKAVVDQLAEKQYVNSLDDCDPQKVWAKVALKDAVEAAAEMQRQFNEHVTKHDPEEPSVTHAPYRSLEFSCARTFV